MHRHPATGDGARDVGSWVLHYINSPGDFFPSDQSVDLA